MDSDAQHPDDDRDESIENADASAEVAEENVETPTATPKRRLSRKVLFAGAGVAMAAIAAYGVDIYVTHGETGRGTSVLGVDISGISPAAAQQKLEGQFPEIASKPVSLRAGETSVEMVPATAGLGINWKATAESAAHQSYNPFSRLIALFHTHDIAPVQTVDEPKFSAELQSVSAAINHEQLQGGIVFHGSVPEAINSIAGQKLDAAKLRGAVQDGWPTGGPVELPLTDPGALVTDQALKQTMREVAIPASSADLVVQGEQNIKATLPRDRIGEVLSFKPDGKGGLDAKWDVKSAEKILAPQLASTEKPARDATVAIGAKGPYVVGEQSGRTVDWGKTLANFSKDMLKPTDRVLTATYGDSVPTFKKADAEKLGIREVIGEFSTSGFEYASGVNIRRTAEQVNGAIVKPGADFSLNGWTGPRGLDQGYVESGVIINGRPGRGVGGGVSQFATTLYNAGYFAGMDDIEHREHSYYISRYPAGREATVWEGSIDVKFRNPAKTGVLIQAIGDDSSITVRIWGTKTVNVESINGGRWDYTSPSTIRLPEGPGCAASGGQDGFTTSDTRVIRDATTNAERSRATRIVVYEPVPVVICEKPKPPAKPDPKPADDAKPAPATPTTTPPTTTPEAPPAEVQEP
ncbi:VanW family protein [Smaragdicoccus niigatensis]|uniref:VanW family protein n=1 Tax=Smaragdicoccus niigatensis TaxID=359359 RepID=UPI0003609064|nr:VanW family protein [Smaragdicoccus niigatensis]